MFKPLTVVIIALLTHSICLSQTLTIDAGDDIIICINHDSLHFLGGDTVAQGGTPPYSYEWYTEPDSNLFTSDYVDDTTTANPRLIYYEGYGERQFFLTVTDSLGAVATDTMSVWYCNQNTIPLGYRIINVHVGDTITFQSFIGLSCELDSVRWSPKSNIISSLDDYTIDVVVDDLNFSHTQFNVISYAKGCVDTHFFDPLIENVYPLSIRDINPLNLRITTANSQIRLDSDEPINRLEIFDLTGRQMLRVEEPRITEVEHALASGIYLLRVQSGDKSQVKKVWLGN